MSEAKPKQCVCGKYPEIKNEVNYYGGGRYKGKTRSESWRAVCRGCSEGNCDHGTTREEAIATWNERVLRDRERRDAPDKLLYSLEHSTYMRSHSTEEVDRALARLIREVVEIKDQLAKIALEAPE